MSIDIEVMTENTRGRDIIIGDVHGCGKSFEEAVRSLGENDRLFSVGDLTDRGPNSLDSIKAAMANKQIFIVRGNHEQMLLDFIKCKRKDDNKWNGLYWKKFAENTQKRPGMLAGLCSAFITSHSAVVNMIHNGGEWVLDVSDDDLSKIEKFLEGLPAIRVVGDTFIVCHADLPFSKHVLRKRIAAGANALTLTPNEMHHVTWARQLASSRITRVYGKHDCDRDDQVTVYYGHEITTKPDISVTRDGHKINLDFGAFVNGLLVGIVHPNTVVVFGEPSVTLIKKNCDKFFSQLQLLHQAVGPIKFSSEAQVVLYHEFLKKHTFTSLALTHNQK